MAAKSNWVGSLSGAENVRRSMHGRYFLESSNGTEGGGVFE